MGRVLTEDEQIAQALTEAADAALRMVHRGVVIPHVPPSALVIVGLNLMEGVVSRKSIATWLYAVADGYADEGPPAGEVSGGSPPARGP